MPAKKAGGVRDASQESRVHVETFSACIRLFLCPRKPPAGRVGAYRIRPPHTPRYGANDHTRRPSIRAVNPFGGRVRYAHHVPGFLRRRPQTPRGLGNDETGCLKVFEGSDLMKQVV